MTDAEKHENLYFIIIPSNGIIRTVFGRVAVRDVRARFTGLDLLFII